MLLFRHGTVFLGVLAAIGAPSLFSSDARAALSMDLQPAGLDEKSAQAITKMILDRDEVKAKLQGSRYRVLNRQFAESLPEKERPVSADGSPQFSIQVYDYTQGKLLQISSPASNPSVLSVKESPDQPPPTEDEFQEAVEILKSDDFFGPAIRSGALRPYTAMPGAILKDGNGRRITRERVIAVGLIPPALGEEGEPTIHLFSHEIVGVSLTKLSVIRYPDRAPPTSIAAPGACGFANAYQPSTRRGTQGEAVLTVRDETGNPLWKLTIVRPSASSGYRGSGIDLRDIFYRGKKVLSHAHMPILNVQYASDLCGPYRDWSYSESPFRAEGDLIEDGILKADGRPQTIFESGTDRGNFRGVAAYPDGDEIVLVSELEAGWYRYKSEFRLDRNGTIRPRWTFGAVRDSCTCNLHRHHAYWRFDFDIEEAEGNVIQAYDGTDWETVTRETKFLRDRPYVRWRVINPRTGNGFVVVPGEDDGTARGDSYARGDVWALAFSRSEIDDSNDSIGTVANIDAFLTGQRIENRDVVLWYAAHFRHHAANDDGIGHTVGPEIRPVQW